MRTQPLLSEALNVYPKKMKDALQIAIGTALDGVDVGFCAFDNQNRTISWNATFLSLFPEHDGYVHIGEPYADNLKRFYSLRLDSEQIKDIDRYIAEGIQRHQTQRRPYEFNHRNFRLRVSSFEIGKFGRLRVWRKVATLPTHKERPVSTTQACWLRCNRGTGTSRGWRLGRQFIKPCVVGQPRIFESLWNTVTSKGVGPVV